MMLLYADDMVILNDTIGRLQNQINVLQEFCNKFVKKYWVWALTAVTKQFWGNLVCCL